MVSRLEKVEALNRLNRKMSIAAAESHQGNKQIKRRVQVSA